MEEMAGCAAAGVGIISQMNMFGAGVATKPNNLEEGTYRTKSILIDGEFRLECSKDISNYCLMTEVCEDDIMYYTPCNFGVWIQSANRFCYNLYVFDTAEFMQGVVSMCSSFKDDFRNRIYMHPFNSSHEFCIMKGYYNNEDTELSVYYREFDDMDYLGGYDENQRRVANDVNNTNSILDFAGFNRDQKSYDVGYLNNIKN